MDERLDRKARAIAEFAEAEGWECEWETVPVEGMTEAVQLVGTRTDHHPDMPASMARQFGFTVAFGIRWETGRVSALCMDGKPHAVFVVVVEDGSGRYWHGPLRAYKDALTDPSGWTGVPVWDEALISR